MVQAHYQAKPNLDMGDPVFYYCKKCHNSYYQTVIEVNSVKCDAHNLTIGFDYKLLCDMCKGINMLKKIEIYPCD